MHSTTMRTITASILLACTCIPGMHADNTNTTFAFGGGLKPTAEDPRTAPLVPPAAPLGGGSPVVVPAPASAPEADLDDPEVFAAFLEDYGIAEGPGGAVTGTLTGSLPKDDAPAAAPTVAPLIPPAFAPAPGPLSPPSCGGLGEECCYNDGMDLDCDFGYACDVFNLDREFPTCVKCGGEGELCCFGADLPFECLRDGLTCDFLSGGFAPTCMVDNGRQFGGKIK